jgi:hypothetical protein
MMMMMMMAKVELGMCVRFWLLFLCMEWMSTVPHYFGGTFRRIWLFWRYFYNLVVPAFKHLLHRFHANVGTLIVWWVMRLDYDIQMVTLASRVSWKTVQPRRISFISVSFSARSSGDARTARWWALHHLKIDHPLSAVYTTSNISILRSTVAIIQFVSVDTNRTGMVLYDIMMKNLPKTKMTVGESLC